MSLPLFVDKEGTQVLRASLSNKHRRDPDLLLNFLCRDQALHWKSTFHFSNPLRTLAFGTFCSIPPKEAFSPPASSQPELY